MPSGKGVESSKVPPRPGGKRAPAPPSSPARRPARPAPGRPSYRTNHGPARAPQRLSARQLALRRQRNLYWVGGISAVVLVIVGGIVVLSVTGGGKSKPPKTSSGAAGTYSISPSQQRQVEDVPLSALLSAAVTSSSSASPPQKLPASTPLLSSGGKPEVLYIGAEWCPFCAAERWPLVMALSKFGTFGPLRGTTSSSTDVLANTPTFSFYHAKYTSKYLAFVPVEEETNTGHPLEKASAAQADLMTRFDRAPYVAANQAGSIPFIYFGGKYLVIGAQYDANPIAGTKFASAVPTLTSGKNATSKGAEAAAGFLVADFCALTHGQPASVCAQVPSRLRAAATSS